MREGIIGVDVVGASAPALATLALVSATMALVGTAPGRGFDIPSDIPLLLTDELRSELGALGSLPAAIEDALSQRGEGGSQGAMIIVVIDEGVDEASTLANVAGDPNQKTGVYVLPYAQSFTGLEVSILAAPGWTHQRDGSPNPVGVALIQVAEELSGRAILDGADSEDAGEVLAHRNDFDSFRASMWYPHMIVPRGAGEVKRPPSGLVAGALSSLETEHGPIFTPLNKALRLVSEPAIPMTYGSQNSRATYYGNQAINCVVNTPAGIRMWGDETLAKNPAEPAHNSMAATHAITRSQYSVQTTLESFIGQPVNGSFFRQAEQLVGQVLDQMVSEGWLLDFQFEVLSRVPPEFRWVVSPAGIARGIQIWTAGGADFGGIDLATLQETVRNMFKAATVQNFVLATGPAQIQVETLRGFVEGQDIKIFSAADPDLAAWGTVTSYDQGTGQLGLSISTYRGEGSFSDGQVVLGAAASAPVGAQLQLSGDGSSAGNLALQLSETEVTGLYLDDAGKTIVIQAERLVGVMPAAALTDANELADGQWTLSPGDGNDLIIQRRIGTSLVNKTI